MVLNFLALATLAPATSSLTPLRRDPWIAAAETEASGALDCLSFANCACGPALGRRRRPPLSPQEDRAPP